MRILLSGSTGLIGKVTAHHFRKQGHEIIPMVRKKGSAPTKSIFWDPSHNRIDLEQMESFDGVIHLAGENIANQRWSTEKKKRIRTSRVNGTRLIATPLAHLPKKPSFFICASAIGFYGDRREEILTEKSPSGVGFLPEVVSEWEEAATPASKAGIRTVNLRIGVVLSSQGGALRRLLKPFRLGFGGRVGSGKQYMSWVSLDDVVRIIEYCIHHEISGPVNAVAPNPITNQEFTAQLGRILKRPTFFPLPACVARTLLGEMAEALLLSSARVYPERLQQDGFKFSHPTLDIALRDILTNR